MRTSRATGTSVLVVALLALGACGAQSEGTEGLAKTNAERLVTAIEEAGVSQTITANRAVELYGTSAPQICGVIGGGSVPGGPVDYDRIVVRVYCPDELPEYDALISRRASISPTATAAS